MRWAVSSYWADPIARKIIYKDEFSNPADAKWKNNRLEKGDKFLMRLMRAVFVDFEGLVWKLLLYNECLGVQ